MIIIFIGIFIGHTITREHIKFRKIIEVIGKTLHVIYEMKFITSFANLEVRFVQLDMYFRRIVSEDMKELKETIEELA
jgi:hypothetical protein